MKKFKIFIPVLLIILSAAFIFPLYSCKKDEADPRKKYTTAQPASNPNKNIFSFSNYDSEIGFNGYLTATEIAVFDDLSAEITYLASNKTIEKDKEKIEKVIEKFNKDIYNDNNYRLFNQGNRVLYIETDSFREEKPDNNKTATNIYFEVYVTNLSYVSSHYKLVSLDDFCKEEAEKKLASNEERAYYTFTDINGKNVTINGMKNSEKFNVFLLEGNYVTSPSVKITFVFEGKVIAFLSPDNKSFSIEDNTITLTPKNSSAMVAVMYQIKDNSVNWYIFGPVIGLCSLFVLVFAIKLALVIRKRAKGKTRKR